MDKVLHIRVELTARATCFDDGTISEMRNFNSEEDISNNRSGGVWDETKPNFNPIFFRIKSNCPSRFIMDLSASFTQARSHSFDATHSIKVCTLKKKVNGP